MMKGRQDGFTIIEVMLFLAISGALFVIAATVMSGAIRDVRFRDGVKSMESFVEKQFTQVQTNAVTRPDLPSGESLQCSLNATKNHTVFTLVTGDSGASNTCIVLGVALHFTDGQIETYPVIGTDTVPAADELPNALASTRPTIYDGQGVSALVTPGPAQAYDLPWQSYWSDTDPAGPAIYTNVSLTHFNTLAILRAPQSEAVNSYVFTPTYDPDGTVTAKSRLYDATSNPSQINQQAIVCLKTDSSGVMRGALVLDGAGGTTRNFSISNISSQIIPSSQAVVGGMNCA